MGSRHRTVFSFPHPVNDVAARVVAGIVVLLTGSPSSLGTGT
jgi:hypothetical protein